MPVTDLGTQLDVLLGLRLVAAVVWTLATLSAFAGFSAFRQRLDLGWAAVFLGMAAVSAGEALVAHRVSLEASTMAVTEATLLDMLLQSETALAAVEMVAAFGVLYLYRARSARRYRRVDREADRGVAPAAPEPPPAHGAEEPSP